MSIQEQKITQEAIAANGVQSQADKLTGTAAQNKKVFDALVTAVVREKFNALLDELTGSGCAAQLGVATIPGFSASDIQTALEQLAQAMQDVTQGSVSDGSITLAKLAAEVTAVALGGAAAEHTHAAADVVSGTLELSRLPVLDAAHVPVLGADKLGAGSVETEKLAAAAVTAEKLAALAVLSTHISPGAVTAQKLAADAVKLTFTNTTVEAASFTADETYGDFPYRAAVPLTGAAEAMTPEVVFGVTDAMSGTFAPVAESYAGGVYIYAAEIPSAAVTIPTILLWR
jgi:hypothetical protein